MVAVEPLSVSCQPRPGEQRGQRLLRRVTARQSRGRAALQSLGRSQEFDAGGPSPTVAERGAQLASRNVDRKHSPRPEPERRRKAEVSQVQSNSTEVLLVPHLKLRIGWNAPIRILKPPVRTQLTGNFPAPRE